MREVPSFTKSLRSRIIYCDQSIHDEIHTYVRVIKKAAVWIDIVKANINLIFDFYNRSEMPIVVFRSSNESIAEYQDTIYQYEYVLFFLQSVDCRHVRQFTE